MLPSGPAQMFQVLLLQPQYDMIRRYIYTFPEFLIMIDVPPYIQFLGYPTEQITTIFFIDSSSRSHAVKQWASVKVPTNKTTKNQQHLLATCSFLFFWLSPNTSDLSQ